MKNSNSMAHLWWALRRRARRQGKIGALIASAALRLVPKPSGDLDLQVWGRQMRLPASHHLPYLVGTNALWSMPLVHCAAALGRENLTVLDIGANVGDTAILLTSALPGRCRLICVEPNPEWMPYLIANTSGMAVESLQCFVGEGQRLQINPRDSGTAGSVIAESGQVSVSLDEICKDREVDLIKIDTDGFDFPILRSGSRTLSVQRPALFFEWAPPLWRAQGEDSEKVFDWLADHGYQDVCFFADSGFFYCRAGSRQAQTIRSLVAAAESRQGIDNLYWDVFAAPSKVCDRAMENNLAAVRDAARSIGAWNRLGPKYWQ